MMRSFNRKYIRWVALLLLVLVLLWRFIPRKSAPSGSCSFENRRDPDQLEYVAHASCRMQCRDVTESLVEEVYSKGLVNCDKSDPKGYKSRGNPRWALEMEDGKRGRVRLVVEEDEGVHKVITVIRLGEEDRCDCS